MKGADNIVTKAQLKAKNKYNAKTYTTVCLRLRKDTEKEIIDFIKSQTNKNEFIKHCVIEAMKKKKRKVVLDNKPLVH